MASERKFVAENIRRTLLREYLMKTVDGQASAALTSRGPQWAPG